jgi:iron(III) transport system ATP-binding protein
MGMVFRSYAVWSHMTVYDNIAYPLMKEAKEKGDEMVRWAINLVRLEGLDIIESQLGRLCCLGWQDQRKSEVLLVIRSENMRSSVAEGKELQIYLPPESCILIQR